MTTPRLASSHSVSPVGTCNGVSEPNPRLESNVVPAIDKVKGPEIESESSSDPVWEERAQRVAWALKQTALEPSKVVEGLARALDVDSRTALDALAAAEDAGLVELFGNRWMALETPNPKQQLQDPRDWPKNVHGGPAKPGFGWGSPRVNSSRGCQAR